MACPVRLSCCRFAARRTGDTMRSFLGLVTALAAASLLVALTAVPALAQSGAFSRPTKFAVGDPPASVAVSDFNGDSQADLALVSGRGYVSILLGAPDGTFSAPTRFPVGSGAHAVAVGDFNGDSDPDLAV